LGKGGKGASWRPAGPAAVRRLGLLVFGAAFVVLFVVVAIAVGLGHPSVPSGDIVLVEDAPGDSGKIGEADFQRALEQSAAQSGIKKVPKPGDKQYEELRETTLNALLDTAWLQGQAEEMGISVSDKEVAAEFKKLKKENFKKEAEYKKFLKESKYTQADVDERVKLQILSTKIQEQLKEDAPTPSATEVKDYYAAAKATQYTQKANRDVRVIVNKDKQKAEQAKALLEKDDSPASWEKVAKKYTEDPATKEKGGLQKGLPEGAAEEPLNAVIFETPEDQVTGLVKTEKGYYVFEVENSTPESVQALKDVEGQIESQLAQRGEQEAFAEFLANYTSTWRSRTLCTSGYTVERCSSFKGNGHPSTAPPACFEANPKGGLPEACPAPVFQLVPALPGSVSPLEPQGKPLAQRPHPAGLKPAAEPEAGAAPVPTH
jgi:foldase protein PrsA